MSEFEVMAQQLDANKKRLESALSSLRPQQAEAPTQQPPPPTQAIGSPTFMEQLIQLVLSKVEVVLTEEERSWFSANLLGVPGFLASASGRSLTRLVFDEYKAWMSK